jgi:hypothetical protein
MATDSAQPAQTTSSDGSTKGPSLGEWLILAACAVGVVVALIAAFQNSDLSLFDAHAVEALSSAWTSTATIGVFVAIGIALSVGFFALLLFRATITSDD